MSRVLAPGEETNPARAHRVGVNDPIDLARKYLDLNKPNWVENTIRASENRIQVHIVGNWGNSRSATLTRKHVPPS